MLISPTVQILVAHKTYCGPDWRWENPAGKTDALNLWCVVDGSGKLTLQERVYQLRAGDCFVTRMWDFCLGEHDPAHPLTVLWAIYRTWDGEAPPPADALPPRYRSLANLPFFAQLFERAISAFNGEDSQGEAAVWMRAVLLALAEEDGRGERLESGLSAQLRELCARIEAAPGHPVRVERLAEEFNLSPGHFTRVFLRCVGLTPRQFITQTRIDAAKSLLVLSNASIQRIAETLGYRDVFHFSRQFREQTGVAPTSFRGGRGR
jgi:AraC family transcriptional regulator of arabinose operon